MMVTRNKIVSARRVATALLAWAVLGVCQSLAAADLRERMSPEVFVDAGLEKLDAAELQVLERWLQDQGLATSKSSDGELAVPVPPAQRQQAPVVLKETAKTSDFGREHLAPAPQLEATKISARIQGEFSGWTGKTLFRLDNGQIWRQRIGGRYRTRAESPQVEVFKGRFGYYLKLLDGGRQVAVKRIK